MTEATRLTRVAVPSANGHVNGLAVVPAAVAPPAPTTPRPRLDSAIIHYVPGRVRLRVPALKRDASLGDRLAGFLRQQTGVRDVRATRASASLVVAYDPAEVTPDQVVGWLGRAAEAPTSSVSRALPRPSALSVVGGAAALALGLLGAPAALTVGLIAASSAPIAIRAVRSLVVERHVSVDVLDATAISVLAGTGDVFSAGLATFLIEGGEYIRAITARRSRAALTGLMGSAGRQAWLARGEDRERVPVDTLVAGDVVIVYPGELVPVDGVVLRGRATVDQKTLTGEWTPVLKGPGDAVYASTVLTDGKVHVRAEKVGAATRASQIVRALEAAPIHDTRIANHAGRFADRLVLPTIALAGTVFALTRNLTRAIAVLVFDLATGVRVSAPTTVLASMTAAARGEILIKGGRALERLAEVDTLVFDKTGTLTTGTPEVVDVRSRDPEVSSDEVLALAASAEERLSHPAAVAIVRAARQRRLVVPARRDSRFTVGMGIEAAIGDQVVHVGSRRYFYQQRIDLSPESLAMADQTGLEGATTVFVARDRRVIGDIAYADVARPEAKAVLARLRERGIRNLIMVTGDHVAVASVVAREVGIDRVEADVFPERKAEIVRELQQAGHVVGVIGDGINDSPALAYADVSFSLKAGTDVARETADVVLHGDLHGLVDAIDLAREAMALLRQNLAIVAVPNAAGLALATAGLIGPVGATAINNGTTVIAAANALRPLLAPPHHSSQP